MASGQFCTRSVHLVKKTKSYTFLQPCYQASWKGWETILRQRMTQGASNHWIWTQYLKYCITPNTLYTHDVCGTIFQCHSRSEGTSCLKTYFFFFKGEIFIAINWGEVLLSFSLAFSAIPQLLLGSHSSSQICTSPHFQLCSTWPKTLWLLPHHKCPKLYFLWFPRERWCWLPRFIPVSCRIIFVVPTI